MLRMTLTALELEVSELNDNIFVWRDDGVITDNAGWIKAWIRWRLDDVNFLGCLKNTTAILAPRGTETVRLYCFVRMEDHFHAVRRRVKGRRCIPAANFSETFPFAIVIISFFSNPIKYLCSVMRFCIIIFQFITFFISCFFISLRECNKWHNCKADEKVN